MARKDGGTRFLLATLSTALGFALGTLLVGGVNKLVEKMQSSSAASLQSYTSTSNGTATATAGTTTGSSSAELQLSE